MSPSAPFRAEHVVLGADRGGAPLTLGPLGPGEPELLGAAFAAIDPWAAYAFPPDRLARFFAMHETETRRWAIRRGDRLIGAVIVSHPWLHGPYLNFLGLLLGHSGQGVGSVVLDWIEREARPQSRNLWLCVSEINTGARRLYERHGYARAAMLDDLSADGMNELLMRKPLSAPAKP